MQLGGSVTVPPAPQNGLAPACTVDEEGNIFTRGHINLSPVPAVGGQLLTILPVIPGGCPCSPETFDVIGTTTALAENPGTSPDVCMVRVQISRTVRADVNLDLVINSLDTNAIQTSPFFNSNSSDLNSWCRNPAGPVGTPVPCGRVDVNQDGRVNFLDVSSVLGAAPNGTSVQCGAIYATAFSCGSNRSAPLTPAVGISLDTIQYFNDDGIINTKRSMDNKWNHITVQVDTLSAKVVDIEQSLEATRQQVVSTRSEVHARLEQQEVRQKQQARAAPKNAVSVTPMSAIIAFGVVICAACVALFAARKVRRQ